MRRRPMPPIKESSVNVTPLIDIVMCLIVFFMLVAKIGVNSGADPDIDIPATQLGKDIKEIGAGSAVILNVREVAGQPFITAMVESDGSVSRTGQPVELKIVDPVTHNPVLKGALMRLRFGRDSKPGGAGDDADNAEFKVIIRGDKNMSYAALEPVLRACMDANVKNVNFNTKKVG